MRGPSAVPRGPGMPPRAPLTAHDSHPTTFLQTANIPPAAMMPISTLKARVPGYIATQRVSLMAPARARLG
jgi:hypothetical protein